MNNKDELLSIARTLTVRVHEPFAQALQASVEESEFDISLLDCYRFAGHACQSITGAFLSTAEAVNQLFPESNVCERGDFIVEFGSELNERATGPRSNIVSFITGSWGETGFPGLHGKFERKNLVSYGQKDIEKNTIRFRRISTGKLVDIQYDPTSALQNMKHGLNFPESWRAEVTQILKQKEIVITVKKQALPGDCSASGCC